jgi:DNA-binding transcriptional regulator LsrR (DeoR family)
MLHLLSPGHPLEQPGTTPTSLVEFYRHSADHVDHIDFHSQPWASAEELERIKRSALHAREAFEQASQIDVIATSIASPADPHCRLRRLLEKLDPESIPRLDARGWRGDVHYHPYNADGAIIGEPEKLPVSLVGIPDLVQIAANPSGKRHVFMVVPPCADCGRLRADALKPLLVNRSLRVFNHLVTDVKTAQKVLA